MPKLWTPAAEIAVEAILRMDREGRDLIPEDDPLADVLRKAHQDAIGLMRRHERVTWAETRRVLDILGESLSEKQEEIAKDEHQVRVVRAGRRSGKALALDTRIPTATGWTTIGEIAVGETLFDETGKTCRVTYTSPVFEGHECFEIVFSDGSRIVADAGHRWKVETKKVRKGGKWEMDRRHDPNGRRAWRRAHESPILTTREMFEHGVQTKAGESEYAIPLCGPLDCPSNNNLPVDPYVLGVWLGDGVTVDSRIYVDDPDVAIIEEMRRRGYRVERKEKRAYEWRVFDLRATLRDHGILGKKEIPAIYLRGSIQQRLDLLAGIVDTDGHVGEVGDVEVTTIHEAFAYQIKELAESLGCKVTIRTGRAMLHGKDCGAKYRVAFSPTLLVSYLPRKRARLKVAHQWQKRYITAINLATSVPTRCIQVDSPSHLFLAGNFIPTHNTYLAALLAAAVMVAKPGSFGWIVGPDYRLAYRCWEMLMKHLAKLESLGIVAFKRKSDTQSNMVVELTNGSRVEGESAEEGDALQGVALDWVIMDEIAQIEEWVFTEILVPALFQRKGWAVLIGTPLEEPWASRKVREMEVQAAHEGNECQWVEFLFESWHNSFEFPKGRFDEKILDMERTMDEDKFLTQVCAMPQASPFLTYGEFDRDVHCLASVKYDEDLPVSLATDPSSGVNPYAVLAIQDYGEHVWVIDEYYKTHVIAEEVINDLATRKWWRNVRSNIIDDAWPHEVSVWRRHPKVHFFVGNAHKSKNVEDSIPLVRSWLREPSIWNKFVEPLKEEYAEELYPGHAFEDLDYYQRAQVMKRVAYKAQSEKEWKFRAAKLFMSKSECPNLAIEMRGYAARKPKKEGINPSERPIRFLDHALDALRYWLWRYKKVKHADPARPVEVVEVPW